MRIAAAVLGIVLLVAGTARAERRINQLAHDHIHVLVLRLTDAGRWELGAGASAGWRPLVDLHARYYLTDRVSVGPRLRLDLDGTPRAVELELGAGIANGKLLVANRLMTQIKLMLEAGGGATRLGGYLEPTLWGGLSLRIQPASARWLSIELRARGAWVPALVPAVARATAPTPAIEGRFAHELGLAVAVMFPGPRRQCVAAH